VAIFDRSKPKGLAEIKIEFTADESEAISRTLERYATAFDADAPERTHMFVHPRVRDGMTAQGLAEYAEDLMREIQESDSDKKITTLMDKAVKAQMKAYAVHNLPVYLFQLARMFEFAGDDAKAKEFFQYFLREQDEFIPDQTDNLFLNFLSQVGVDLPKIVTVAKEKVRQTERRKEYADPAEQIMFILGFKYDPKFDTVLHAVAHGSNPGIIDALHYFEVHGAIFANLRAWALTVRKLQDEIGANLPPALKDDIYRMIVAELDEKHYGGRWFQQTSIPSDDWINMASYSPLFVRGSEVFCLPAPYFRVLGSVV
jgi:hypothetical protein